LGLPDLLTHAVPVTVRPCSDHVLFTAANILMTRAHILFVTLSMIA